MSAVRATDVRIGDVVSTADGPKTVAAVWPASLALHFTDGTSRVVNARSAVLLASPRPEQETTQ